MIHKVIFPESYNFGMEQVALIDTFSKGLRKEAMHKRAAMFDDILPTFERKPKHAYLHVITMGAFEKYGPNLNGDAYNGAEMKVNFESPCKQASRRLAGGLEEFHDKTYMENGAVYKEHKNKYESGKKTGYLVKAAYNKRMSRGELLIGVNEDDWRPELEKKANGKEIYLSMAADVPYDICSVCGHESRDRDDYCDHAKHNMLGITKQGTVICVYNDQPMFHDISGVFTPADKIAFALRKVASGKGAVPSAILAEQLGMIPRKLTKRAAYIKKLSEIEKSIPMELKSVTTERHGTKDICDKLMSKVNGSQPMDVLSAAKSEGIMLPPEAFFSLMLGEEEGKACSDKARESLPGTFERVAADPETLDAFAQDGTYDINCMVPNGLKGIMQEFKQELGVDKPSEEVSVIIASSKPIKIMSTKEASAGDALAMEYAKYVASTIEGLEDTPTGKFAILRMNTML